ncbi:hypothetical protein EJ02DRAFT_506444 [Clathrospora elynae]|uniref:Rhodopsin domain-containing protein n=1 Tax=Clathrospora elynae TaxID=706981 RepID=A0A6A5SGP1_9PLEO|nr:hypothetical protein EJ02DRAFT_506444 [Clathrospora elynae]
MEEDPEPQEWPNQRLKIMIPVWTLMVISTIFLVWRCVYSLLRSRKFMACDYLLIMATVLNITATSTNQVVIDNGLGRHILDPSVLPNILKYSYYLWMTQIINIIAVACLKWSICAWLLVLNFSKLYQGIIWLSILMVTAFNFLAPVFTLFGCIPLEKNWNHGYTGKGKCWAVGTLELSYTQGISNIITDVVYMAAPLIYLSRVQLSKRTQWGIRTVFLLSIPATICSIFKTIELKEIVETRDPTWDTVNLGIWSSAELSIGILIASLPPLRKAFDSFFKMILPSTLANSAKTPKYGYGHSSDGGIHLNTFQGSKAYHSRIRGESVLGGDDESERAILEGEENKESGILKSTKVTVTDEEDGSSSSKDGGVQIYEQSNDWPSPQLEQGERRHAR